MICKQHCELWLFPMTEDYCPREKGLCINSTFRIYIWYGKRKLLFQEWKKIAEFGISVACYRIHHDYFHIKLWTMAVSHFMLSPIAVKKKKKKNPNRQINKNTKQCLTNNLLETQTCALWAASFNSACFSSTRFRTQREHFRMAKRRSFIGEFWYLINNCLSRS